MSVSRLHGDVESFLLSSGLRSRLERVWDDASSNAHHEMKSSFPFEASLVCFFFPATSARDVAVYAAPWARAPTMRKWEMPAPQLPSNATVSNLRSVPVEVRAVWLQRDDAEGDSASSSGDLSTTTSGILPLRVCTRSLGTHHFSFASPKPAAPASPLRPDHLASAMSHLSLLVGGSTAAEKQDMLLEAARLDGGGASEGGGGGGGGGGGDSGTGGGGGGGGGGSGGGGDGGGGATAASYTISQPRPTEHSAVDVHMALQALAADIELLQEELKECDDESERQEKQEMLQEAILERAQLEEVLAAHAGDAPPPQDAALASSSSASLVGCGVQMAPPGPLGGADAGGVGGVGVLGPLTGGPGGVLGGPAARGMDTMGTASPPISPFLEVQRRLSGLPQTARQQQLERQRAVELNWRFTQSFGDDNSSDDDLVTAMEFDKTGRWLAVGDKAGRICVFEGFMSEAGTRNPFMDYRFYTEFQSHEPEFDCLKSLEIEEKINVIRWVNTPSTGQFILSSNDKTIKLWKLHEKRLYEDAPPEAVAPGDEPEHTGAPGGTLRVPRPRGYQLLKTATNKRVYAHAHQYHINSLSINPDGETFVSVDDLRINMWHLENNTESFNIIDIKPHDLKQLNEVITTAAFHPQACNLLMYGTSRGNIRITDMRQRALCEDWARQFQNEALSQTNHFFTEIISSVSSAEFTPDGMHVLSRDYLTVKLWDLRNESRPVHTVPVHDYLTPYLPELYDNDCMFDKFNCSTNSTGTRFVTGSYNNHFMVHDTTTGTSTTIEAKDDPRDSNTIVPDEPNVDVMDFARKALHTCWHPTEDVLAVAGVNKIYVYSSSSLPC